MIKHLLKIVWNRKRANLLITLEILISFLVIFSVMASAVYIMDIFGYPLGFTYQDVWNVRINTKTNFVDTDKDKVKYAQTINQLLVATKDFKEIEAVAGLREAVFGTSISSTSFTANNQTHRSLVNETTDDLPAVLGIKLVEGRWFDKTDDGVAWTPIVINERLSKEVFGSQSPLGQILDKESENTPRKVVGVITDFRDKGELIAPQNYFLYRNNLSDPQQMDNVQNFVIRLHPGTSAAFEEQLVHTFQGIAKDWSFDIQPLETMRYKRIKTTLTPILAVGLIAVFLMIMVGLGLTGVLWQNVTQRTREIGLRRANGATKGQIHYQILGELLVIASAALLVGTIIVIQFPLLNVLGFISSKVYIITLVLSGLMIYGLTLLCGLYPSILATLVPPAEALHYE